MDQTHPSRAHHAGAAIQHLAHGAGIHAEVLPDEVGFPTVAAAGATPAAARGAKADLTII